MWDYLLRFILFSLLSELFRPKPKIDRPAAAGLKDLGLPTVDEKRPLPWLIGRARQDAPNLTGTFDFKTVARSKKQRTGLASSTTIPLGYHYYVGSVMTLCAGRSAVLKEVWAGSGDDAVLIWSGTLSNGGYIDLDYQKSEKGQEDYPQGFKGRLRFYSGNDYADTYLESKVGAGNVPAWPHATYVVLTGPGGVGGMWVGTTGQVLPISFVVERPPGTTSIGLGNIPDDVWDVRTNAAGDANVALAIAELLTDKVYWAGEHPDFINKESIWNAARQCAADGQYVGTLIDQQRSAADVIFEFCRQAGAVLQPDPTTGNHTLKLLRANDTPVLTLDDSNIERFDSFARTSLDEATNAVTVNYLDRAANFKQRPMTVQDLAAVQAAGVVISSTQQYSSITSANLASIIATRDLRAMSSPLASARVTAIVPKRQRLLPGDLVTLSSTRNGIGALRMRVTSARFSEPGRGLCELELLEDVFSTGIAVYAPPLAATPPAVLGAPGPIESTIFGWPNGVVAPREISGAAEDQYHAIYFAGADALNAASGYRLGYLDAGSLEEDGVPWNDKGTVGFAAKGALLIDSQASGIGTNVLVAVSTVDAETIRRNGSTVVWVCHDDHGDTPIKRWYQGYAVLTGANTARITLTARVPEFENWYAGDDFWLLYDYAIDPKPIATNVVGTGTENVVVDGEMTTIEYNLYETVGGNSCRAQTIGAGGYGTWAPLPWPRDQDYRIAPGKALPRWSTY